MDINNQNIVESIEPPRDIVQNIDEVQEHVELDEKKKVFMRMMLQQWKRKKQNQQTNNDSNTTNNDSNDTKHETTIEQTTQNLQSQVFSREEYAQNNFWDNRYTEHKGQFDWYVEYPQLKSLISEPSSEFYIPPQSSILMVGCGNSKLTEQMFKAGYSNILSIDISEVVVQRMNESVQGKMKFEVMDATAMPLGDGSYDYVLDKGTLDALACGTEQEAAQKLIQEMLRVAAVAVVIVSHSSCAKRETLFRKCIPISQLRFLENRVELSGQSELINIIRSHLKDKPLSHIMKDPKALIDCMNIFKQSQRQKQQALDNKEFIFKSEELPQLQEQQEIDTVEQQLESQFSQEIEQIKESDNNEQPKQVTDINEQSEQSEQTEQTNKKEQSEQTEQTIQSELLDSQENEKSSIQQGPKPTKLVYAPVRQNHCYIYKITKI